jgi:hypothetical protein
VACFGKSGGSSCFLLHDVKTRTINKFSKAADIKWKFRWTLTNDLIIQIQMTIWNRQIYIFDKLKSILFSYILIIAAGNPFITNLICNIQWSDSKKPEKTTCNNLTESTCNFNLLSSPYKADLSMIDGVWLCLHMIFCHQVCD